MNILQLGPLLIFITLGLYPGSIGRSRGSTVEKLLCLNKGEVYRGKGKAFLRRKHSFVGLLFVLGFHGG